MRTLVAMCVVGSLQAGAGVTAQVEPPAPAAIPSPPVVTAKPWPQEPESYRGILWGAPLDDARRQIGAVTSCLCVGDASGLRGAKLCKFESEKDAAKVPAQRTCFSGLAVGDVSVKDQTYFLNDKFAGASMTFSAENYEKMATVFLEKYGPATTTEESEVSNRMGAKFTQRELTWAGPRVNVTLNRYGSKLTEGLAMLTTTELQAHFAAMHEAQKKKGTNAF